jgi:hypothetical protein
MLVGEDGGEILVGDVEWEMLEGYIGKGILGRRRGMSEGGLLER